MKKWALTLGSIASVVAPVTAVVACGTEDPKPQLVEDHQLLKSNRAMSLIENNWHEQVLNELLKPTVLKPTVFDKTNPLAVDLVKDTLVHILHKKLMNNKDYLRTLANKILVHEEFMKGAGATTEQKTTQLRTWGLLQYIENGNITVASSGAGHIDLEALKFIMKNMKDIRNEVYKKVISVKYLLDTTTSKYQNRMVDTGKSLSELDLLIDSSNFMLIKKMIDLHLFTKWEISLDSHADTYKWMDMDMTETTVNVSTLAEASKQMVPASDNFASDASFKTKQEKSTALDLVNHNSLIGYKGIVAVNGGKGKLQFDKDGLIKGVNQGYWAGGIKDGNLVAEFKDDSLKTLNYVEGILPIYNGTKLTLTNTTFDTQKELLALELTDHGSVYEEAISYLLKDNDDNTDRDKFLFEIKSEQLRKAAIEHGFKFIKE